jgi:uncharacterized membrane protein YfcA
MAAAALRRSRRRRSATHPPQFLLAAMAPVLVFIILAASALVTSFISGILGMAGGMILMGILLALVSVPVAMMLHGITQLAANGWRAWLWRTHIDRRVFMGYVLGSLVALVAFAVLQFVVSKPVAYIVLGLTPFVGLLLPESLHLNVERRGHPFACGLICTALQLAAGVSGPILDVFFVRSSMTRQQVVATKAITQSCGHTLKIVYFGTIVTAGVTVNVPLAVCMVVLAFVGTTLSRTVLDRINDADFRKWTKWTVLSLGVFYLASGALMLI